MSVVRGLFCSSYTVCSMLRSLTICGWGEKRCDDGSVFGVNQTIYLRLPGPVPGQGVA